MHYPLQFEPILKERVWAGDHLAPLYCKPIPLGRKIGESWEISDRPEGASLVRNGPLAGRDLRWLMEHHRTEILGRADSLHSRFPLLCKILDAGQKLSLQVHPPAALASQLGGEPKTEMWYVAHAEPGAELYAGLQRGVTRALFEQKVADGTVAQCFHRLPVQRGDVLFLPSGRVHALGAGLVIFEIQQNSDTTYRVFDWNRVGLDGKPRELHIEQSLACIDFNDFEPELVQTPWHVSGCVRRRALVRSDVFRVDQIGLPPQSTLTIEDGQMRIVAVVEGGVELSGADATLQCAAGQFCLLPASRPETQVSNTGPATLLEVML